MILATGLIRNDIAAHDCQSGSVHEASGIKIEMNPLHKVVSWVQANLATLLYMLTYKRIGGVQESVHIEEITLSGVVTGDGVNSGIGSFRVGLLESLASSVPSISLSLDVTRNCRWKQMEEIISGLNQKNPVKIFLTTTGK